MRAWNRVGTGDVWRLRSTLSQTGPSLLRLPGLVVRLQNAGVGASAEKAGRIQFECYYRWYHQWYRRQ